MLFVISVNIIVDNIITKYSISSKYRKIMAIIRLNQIGQNEYEKVKTINKKIARTRRQRGYNWEDTLVKRFNAIKSW
ncbi:MAG: hypothetical protein U9M99_04645, partial [Thermoproteota archaeon]|nr:hypothetical protein [Thermoproteota archaeon]